MIPLSESRIVHLVPAVLEDAEIGQFGGKHDTNSNGL